MQQNFPYLNRRREFYFLHLLIPVLLVFFFLPSCYNIKTSAYFKTIQKDTTLSGFISNDFESKIQKSDILGITVSSMSKEMDEMFNAGASTIITVPQRGPEKGFLVSEKGTITIHLIGTLRAEGLTRKQLKAMIEEALLPYMKEPIISVEYLNHKVTILGEVMQPAVLNMPTEQMSLLDLIVAGGDVKENANRRDVMVIREENNTKQVKHINLEDHSIFTSPWYYVKPNDIVYVMPDAEKYIKEENRKKLQTNLSLGVSVISLIIIILNIVLK